MKKTDFKNDSGVENGVFASSHPEPKAYSKSKRNASNRAVTYEYYHDKDDGLSTLRGLGYPVYAHFHRCIEILYVTKGGMLCEVEDERFTAEADDIVFMHSYAVHSFEPAPDYEKYGLVIPMNYADDAEKFFKSSSLPALLSNKKLNAILLPIFKKLYDENDELPQLVKKGYLNIILGYLISGYPAVPYVKKEGIELIVDILSYIDAHHAEKITLASISQSFGYNKYYFSKLFNRYVGESLNAYVNVVRLQHFNALGKEYEHASVAERAFACGFDSLTTFYRYYNRMRSN